MSALTQRTFTWLERWFARPLTLPEKIGAAVAATATATALRYAVAPFIGVDVPFAFYFPALVIASFVGGKVAGFLTLFFSLAVSWLAFIGPAMAFDFYRGMLLLGTLAISGALVICSCALLRHAVIELKLRRAAQQTLLSEMNHRIKNVYSVIQAMSMQTARAAKSLEDHQQRFNARLQALASAQNVLIANTVDAASLSDIVKATLAPFMDTRAAQVTIAGGPDIRLDSQACTGFALALHELGTNALKYGALAKPQGRIRVEWRFDGTTRRLDFAWHETGVPEVVAPTHKGFGTRLIEQTFAQEGDRRIDISYRSGGLSCEISCTLRGGA